MFRAVCDIEHSKAGAWTPAATRISSRRLLYARTSIVFVWLDPYRFPPSPSAPLYPLAAFVIRTSLSFFFWLFSLSLPRLLPHLFIRYLAC